MKIEEDSRVVCRQVYARGSKGTVCLCRTFFDSTCHSKHGQTLTLFSENCGLINKDLCVTIDNIYLRTEGIYYLWCDNAGALTFDPLLFSRIELGDVTPHNLKQLKKLNSVVFPITYTDDKSA